MHTAPQDNYLATEVMTATPQRLHLMLLDATMRQIERARRHWHAGQDESACQALVRAQEMLIEMVGSLNHEINGALTKKVAAIYLFVHRSLLEANLRHEETKLDDALKVLQVERETWHTVCEKLGSTCAAHEAGTVSLSADASARPNRGQPPLPHTPAIGDMPTHHEAAQGEARHGRLQSQSPFSVPETPLGGFSFEA